MQAGLWTIAGGAVALVLVAGLADWRRNRRRDLDRVGWVPWPLVMILAMIVAAVATALALKAR
ncbi:MAG: hypothetical protein JWL91_1117 [Sphingomonas bacterium]|nr:hypothetical protein [Sphingomonas bacterium]MDB5689241.1 hypothetical protein [Sphingomonas bacterium]